MAKKPAAEQEKAAGTATGAAAPWGPIPQIVIMTIATGTSDYTFCVTPSCLLCKPTQYEFIMFVQNIMIMLKGPATTAPNSMEVRDASAATQKNTVTTVMTTSTPTTEAPTTTLKATTRKTQFGTCEPANTCWYF